MQLNMNKIHRTLARISESGGDLDIPRHTQRRTTSHNITLHVDTPVPSTSVPSTCYMHTDMTRPLSEIELVWLSADTSRIALIHSDFVPLITFADVQRHGSPDILIQ